MYAQPLLLILPQESLVVIEEMEPEPRKLLNRVREARRRKHSSIRTEQAYVNWINRFIFFHHKRHPNEMGGAEAARGGILATGGVFACDAPGTAAGTPEPCSTRCTFAALRLCVKKRASGHGARVASLGGHPPGARVARHFSVRALLKTIKLSSARSFLAHRSWYDIPQIMTGRTRWFMHRLFSPSAERYFKAGKRSDRSSRRVFERLSTSTLPQIKKTLC